MQNVAMIPAKEAKMFTYKLLEHNFLQIKELKKGTSNFAPVKSFILFHVDLPQVRTKYLDGFLSLVMAIFFYAIFLNRLSEHYWKRVIKGYLTRWCGKCTT
jgi:hypothetical protein